MKIVFCIDEHYLDMAKESIKSYRKYNPTAEIIVVCEKFYTDYDKIGADKVFKIPLPENLRFRGAGDRISRAAYLKLFLPKLPFSKVLYVDADTLCQKPLDELWNMNPEYIALTESHAFGRYQAQALGADKYGLTGMMLMNLTALRAMNFTELCLDVNNSKWTPSTGWQHDETCINIALRGKLTFIDKKFNYCHNRTYYAPINESDAYILHFVGRDKDDMFYFTQKYKQVSRIGRQLRKKSVAIVGNAKSLFDKQYGAEIDNHDFVIRFNKGFIVDEKSQGKKTDILMLALNLPREDIDSYRARYVINRSKHYSNNTMFTMPQEERMELAQRIGKQPSSGLMAIDFVLTFKASKIDVYGFDFEATPTFYNPKDYQTQHDYAKEKEIILSYAKSGLINYKV